MRRALARNRDIVQLRVAAHLHRFDLCYVSYVYGVKCLPIIYEVVTDGNDERPTISRSLERLQEHLGHRSFGSAAPQRFAERIFKSSHAENEGGNLLPLNTAGSDRQAP
jgi:hypothetical protein